MAAMTRRLRYLFLLAVKYFSRLFYRHERHWLHEEPGKPWHDLRVVAILNHTSLFEWLLAGAAPNHLLRAVAYRGVIPAADITMRRPLIGPFLRTLAPDVVPITRQKDSTWSEVLRRLHSDRILVILPEGRMKRSNGLDKHGKPMTVRGGIADFLQGMGDGRMLLAYSGGLHHIQAPGEGLPRLFKTVRVGLELVDIAGYKQGLETNGSGFKRAVMEDLERRRDLHCPRLEDPRAAARPADLPR